MRYIIAIFIALFLISCNSNSNTNEKEVSSKINQLSGSILEKLDVNKYTYVKIKSNNKEIWLAGPKEEVKVGDKISVASGMLMKDFVSKTLNRTFKEIYFVGSLTGKNRSAKANFHAGMNKGTYHGGSKGINPHTKVYVDSKLEKELGLKKLEKVEGGYSIEEIYQQKTDLNGKTIKVKGVVVKFASEIMKRNWIHIKDGSGKTGGNDLTITTNDIVKIGETVIFEGKLAVDKDFGYGYKYSVILESSSIK